jgi:hypothetical protein
MFIIRVIFRVCVMIRIKFRVRLALGTIRVRGRIGLVLGVML